MPDDIESLGFTLEFFTKYNGLEKLHQLLNGTIKDVNKLKAAILDLNRLSNVFQGTATLARTKGKNDKAKYWEKASIAARTLSSKLVSKRSEIETDTATSTTTAKETLDVPDASKITRAAPSGEVYKTVTTAGKDGKDVITSFSKSVEAETDKIVETVVKRKGDEVLSITDKYTKKSTYKASDFSGLGKVIKTQTDAITDSVIQTTEETIGDSKIIRTYVDGVLKKTVSKEIKRKATPSSVTVPAGTPLTSSTSSSFLGGLFGKGKEFYTNSLLPLIKGKGEKSKFSHFASRVKNIITYRLVRVAMSAINKGITEGFTLLSTSNSQFKQITVNFKTASTALSVSIAQILLPFAETLSNTLLNVSNSLLSVSNAMSLTNAMAKGQSEYFKLDANAIEEYSKQLANANKSLSQLDKFATLSDNKPILGKWVTITNKELENIKNTKREYEGITNFVRALVDLLNGVGKIIDFINNLTAEQKVNFKGIIVLGLALITSILTPAKAIILGLATAIISIVNVWSSELNPVAKVFVTLLITAATVLAFIAALTKTGAAKIPYALGAAAAAAGALGLYTSASNLQNKKSTPDTGNEEVSNSVVSSSYTNRMESGAISNVNSNNMQSQVVASDVYLDKDKVGKALFKTVNKYERKAGF